jgi:hypothetical protein
MGQPERAACLLGASEAIRVASRTPLPPYPVSGYERDVTAVRDALSSETFTAAWAEGRAMTIEQAIAYALRIIWPYSDE